MGMITFGAGLLVGGHRHRRNRKAAERRHRERMAQRERLANRNRPRVSFTKACVPLGYATAGVAATAAVFYVSLACFAIAVTLLALPWLAVGAFVGGVMGVPPPWHMVIALPLCAPIYHFTEVKFRAWRAARHEAEE